jgi:hypothetical protein
MYDAALSKPGDGVFRPSSASAERYARSRLSCAAVIRSAAARTDAGSSACCAKRAEPHTNSTIVTSRLRMNGPPFQIASFNDFAFADETAYELRRKLRRTDVRRKQRLRAYRHYTLRGRATSGSSRALLFDGQMRSPYEQKTQQSPVLGLSSDLHDGHR